MARWISSRTLPKYRSVAYLILFLGFSMILASCNYPGIPDPDFVPENEGNIPNNPGDGGGGGEGADTAYLADDSVSIMPGESSTFEGGEEDLKPVGFTNYGEFDAVVMAWTYVPLGDTQSRTPSGASTVSSANIGSGTWPNTSRYLSVPMGTYTWCIDWEQGDLDEDGYINYFHYIEEAPTLLDENDSDDLEFAEEVAISAPPAAGTIVKGRCDQPLVESSCAGNELEVNVFSKFVLEENNKPETFTYTNTADYPPPDGIQVAVGGISTSWGSGMVLWQAGDWIQATTADPFKSIGAQIHGDQTIGWARVLFDGVEVWQGDASSYTIADGRYGLYVEVSCFSPGSHTLRVEAAGINGGGGGMSVPVANFGFRSE